MTTSAKDIADALLGVIGANDQTQAPRHWLDTGFPPLNKAISGSYQRGLPSGRMIEIFGMSSSGKTVIATQAMISAQQAGGIAMFNDHERSFDARLAEKLGLDLTPGRWIFKTPETFEKSISSAMKLAQVVRDKKLIDPKAPIVCVFDSLASMVPRVKFEKIEEDENFNMNDNTALARATSQVFPGLMQWCERYEMTAIFLNQVRTKVGVVYGDPTTTPGGGAPEYYASVRIKLAKSQMVSGTGAEKEKIGARITADVVKNKVSRPFRKATWDFVFEGDSGKFDVTGSLIDHMADNGFIEKAGNYLMWEGKKYYRNQLAEKINAEGKLAELKKLLPATVEE